MPRDGVVVVRFEEGEDVTQFGTTKTTYRVRLDRVWTDVSRVANATVHRLHPPPGTVWSRIVELPLALGTEVERCVESPRRQPTQASTLELLLGRSRPQQRSLRRVRLLVGAGGRLRAVPSNA